MTDGSYVDGWKPTKDENPNFVCTKCGSCEIVYREWESSCGGYDDVHYHCNGCGRDWWVEGSDA